MVVQPRHLLGQESCELLLLLLLLLLLSLAGVLDPCLVAVLSVGQGSPSLSQE